MLTTTLVLALTGSAGCSGAIMEKQFSTLMKGLDATFEWIFVDGDLDAPRAKGRRPAVHRALRHADLLSSDLPHSVRGPYLAYYDNLDPASMQRPCELVASVIDDEGPFDGFIGFSQGAAVGLSFLVDWEINRPDEPLPFKWAMFFSSIVAASPDVGFMRREMSNARDQFDEVVESGMEINLEDEEEFPDKTVKGGRLALWTESGRQRMTLEIINLLRVCLAGASDLGLDTSNITQGIKDGTITIDQFPRIFHPLLVSQRLRLPTLHVAGKKDNPYLLRQARLMKRLCASESSVYMEHSSLHELPADAKELDSILKAMQRLIEGSRFRF